MAETKKVKKEDALSFSIGERKDMIKQQLQQALNEREKYNNLVFKCQGALELLEGMDGEKGDD